MSDQSRHGMIGEQLSNVSRFEVQAGFEAILVFRPWVCRQSRKLRRRDDDEEEEDEEEAALLACPPLLLPVIMSGR